MTGRGTRTGRPTKRINFHVTLLLFYPNNIPRDPLLLSRLTYSLTPTKLFLRRFDDNKGTMTN